MRPGKDPNIQFTNYPFPRYIHSTFIAFFAQPTISVILDEARDGVLLRDIERLSDILGSVVERDNPEVYGIFSRFRNHGENRQKDVNDVEPLQRMVQCAKDLSNENALGVMRCFSIALNLVNSAEVHHRMRVLREMEREADKGSDVGGPLPMTEDSMRGTIQILIDEGGTKEEIFDAMMNQQVEIVLTAHPTEVSRRTMLEKYKKVTAQLEILDRPDLNPYMEAEAMGTLKRIVGESTIVIGYLSSGRCYLYLCCYFFCCHFCC